LNIFKGENDNWAIAGERLGYNPRGGCIFLDVYYWGNCLSNLYYHPVKDAGYNTFTPIDWDSYQSTLTEEEYLRPDSKFWLVRGVEVPLSHSREDYLKAGIDLIEDETINIEEASRLVITKHRHLFRATDEELYQSIPSHLNKILVIDEWHQRDYLQMPVFEIDESHQESLGQEAYEKVLRSISEYEEINRRQWQENRPSAYETWQQIAKVIVTGDPAHYQPTIAPNTHWKNWPQSGSL
jgi:hypothetical protein